MRLLKTFLVLACAQALCAFSVFAHDIFAHDYGKLPLSFEQNQGQADSRVQFLARGRAESLLLTSTEAILRGKGDVVRLKIAGGNASAKAAGAERQIATSNYFIGNDPAKWRTGVPHFGRVQFQGVYPGIDVVYYGRNGQLEYDWVVKPGADPAKIRLRFEGVRGMRVDASGDLVLETRNGELREKRPTVYQDGEIAGRYVLRGRREAAFELGPYDRTRQLVIDPVLVYASYLGGSNGDQGNGIAADSAGNAYVVGTTTSADFPTEHPFQGTNHEATDQSHNPSDAFVSKISADGSTLLYSTYLGGHDSDYGNAIAVDAAGDAYVTGTTMSEDFPLAHAFQSTNQSPFGVAFVTKLNPTGSALLFSTYLGGVGGGADIGLGIALDHAANAYITGENNSGGSFPLVNPIEGYNSKQASTGAFVTKMSADGSTLLYSTFIGGYNGQNFANAIAVDATGAAYVAGETSAPDFITVNPIQATNKGDNAFVAKLNPAGSAFVYATFLGGSLKAAAYGIAVDSSGNAYITGTSRSTDFPTVHAYEQAPTGGAAFVSKINAGGSALVYSTYLGKPDDTGYGIAVNSSGEAWVTGNGSVPSINDFPHISFARGFVCQFSAAGTSLLFSSPIWLTSELQGGIAVDASGNVYATGLVGGGGLTDPSGFQTTFGGEEDAVVVKVAGGPLVPSITAVVNGASFEPPLVPGSWGTIEGTGLSSVTDTWDKFIVNGKLPTSVDGVSVSVGGKPAYIYYVSASQINFIVPDAAAGSQPVTVTNAVGTSAPATAKVSEFGPAFFGWPNNQVVATRQDFSLAAAPGTFTGATTVAAKPGDTIILWGTGFGVTNPAAPQGEATPSNATYSTETLPTVEIEKVPVKVYGAALAPGFAGLYQVAIQVPESLGAGNWPIAATIGGATSPAGAVLAVHP